MLKIVIKNQEPCLYKPRGTLAIVICIMYDVCTVYHVFQTAFETAHQQKEQVLQYRFLYFQV